MRRDATTIPLEGQLLFAEEAAGAITIDCLLTRAGSNSASVPVTLEARFPGQASPRAALDLLEDWASCSASVEVRIQEGAHGPEVEITSGKIRLVLEPEQ